MAADVTQAWQTAGVELSIRVEAPARVMVGGDSMECSAFLPDFGSANGAAIFSRSLRSELPNTSDPAPFCSLLNDDSYGGFDRDLFIATLNDWGWFGGGDPPDWFTGAAWTD